MVAPTSRDAATVRRLLAEARSSDPAGQQALERLYRHYDPLIRAALPKGLAPDDAEDLVMDTWAEVVGELRRGRGLRDHDEVVAMIAAHLQGAGRPASVARPQTRQHGGLWPALRRFVRLLLPVEDE
ncbi:MAG: hypothetical protein ACOX3S_13200 [Anaerolineae bacterium]|jgi:hypothetical protein